jgi:hypothetical protein
VDSNNVSLVDTINHPKTEYRDSLGIGGLGLQKGQIYYYRIKAVNQHGSGPFSDAAFASIPEIRFSELVLPNSTDTTFSLNQAQFVRDPDFGISQLQWDVQDLIPGDSIQHNMVNANTINFITPNDTLNEDLLQFRVFDADSFYDEQSISISLTAPTFAPIVSNIPNQTISIGQSFSNINLDDYVTDADNNDSEITWTTSGENNLNVNIDPVTHVATITSNNQSWAGSETITFRATDPSLLFDEDQAVFTIQAAPQVANIPDQTIQTGQAFTEIDLDAYVTDADNDTSQLTWTTFGATNIAVTIDNISHVASFNLDNPNWTGSNTIIFRATDPSLLFGQDTALFRVIAPPVISPIPNQTIERGQAFSTFDLDDYVTDPDNPDDQLTWTISGENNLTVNINSNSHVVTVTINDTSWVGSETINFQVTDPDGLSNNDDVLFSVNLPGNNDPVITSIPVESAKTGEFYSYLVSADDVDGDSLVFSLINGTPDFLDVVRNDSTSATSAFVSGIPPLGSDGTYDITILVSDNRGGTDTQIYELTVTSSSIESSPEIIAYPTPYVAGRSPANRITFGNVPLNAELMLFNLIGEPVFSTKVEVQPYSWNIKNNSGLEVQSGLYFYYVKEGGKVISSGKIVIIR